MLRTYTTPFRQPTYMFRTNEHEHSHGPKKLREEKEKQRKAFKHDKHWAVHTSLSYLLQHLPFYSIHTGNKTLRTRQQQ